MPTPVALASYRLYVEDLLARHGHDRFRAFVRAVLAEPAAVDRALAATFGVAFADDAAAWASRVRAGAAAVGG